MLEACQRPPARPGCVDAQPDAARSGLHPRAQRAAAPPPSFGLPQCLTWRQHQTGVARPYCLGCSVTMFLCHWAGCVSGAQAHSHRPAQSAGRRAEPERALWRKGEGHASAQLLLRFQTGSNVGENRRGPLIATGKHSLSKARYHECQSFSSFFRKTQTIHRQLTLNHRVPGSSPGAPTNT